jgi:hypothetical protein
LPDAGAARARAVACIAKLPPALRSLDVVHQHPVEYSKDLTALIERTRRNLA